LADGKRFSQNLAIDQQTLLRSVNKRIWPTAINCSRLLSLFVTMQHG